MEMKEVVLEGVIFEDQVSCKVQPNRSRYPKQPLPAQSLDPACHKVACDAKAEFSSQSLEPRDMLSKIHMLQSTSPQGEAGHAATVSHSKTAIPQRMAACFSALKIGDYCTLMRLTAFIPAWLIWSK